MSQKSPNRDEPQHQGGPTNWQLITRLLKFSWQFRGRCIQVIIFQSLILLFTIGAVNLTGLAIDFLKDHLKGTDYARWPFGLRPPEGADPMNVILVIGGVIAIFAFTRAIVEYFNELQRNRLVHVDIVLKLRGEVYEKLQKLSFRFFDHNASGTLINRVTSDVQAVRMFIDQVVVQIFIMVVSLTVYLAYMLSYHVWLTVACLATTPLLWIFSAYFSRMLHPAYMQHRRLMDNLVLTFSENTQGIQTIMGFSLQGNRSDTFEKANTEVRDQRQKIFWLVSIFGPSVGMLTQINLLVLLGYGGYLVMIGELPLGTGLVAFAALLQQFSGQIANLAGVADSIQQSLTGARRVFEILDAPVEVETPKNPVKIERVRGHLQFEHVWFEYKQHNVILKDIHFDVKPGEVVAVAGATGSGKSALMSLLPRFYDPIKGRILLDGYDLKDISLTRIRRNIGIVFQENFLFSNSVAANISFGHPKATREQIEKAARIACAHDFIMELPKGYDTILSESGQNLSGGQRQRLAIARAVLLEPAILLLDDPTAAIDPETEHEILEAIERAIEGRTTFVVAHRLSTLRRADKVIVLEHGRIAQFGRHQDLMKTEGLYKAAVEMQAVDPESMALLAQNRSQKEGGSYGR